MVLDTQREHVDPLLSKIAAYFTHVHPDVLTWLALLFAILAGIFFYFSHPTTELTTYYLLLGAFFVFCNGLFDAIDGKVAKITHTISKRGDFLDHALDRYADVFIIGGIALSSWCRPSIGFLAIIGVLLTSYMGTQAQAIGYQRNYSGLLGRADRIVLLMIIPPVQHLSLQHSTGYILDISMIEWILIYFAIMGNITAVQRFITTLHWFSQKKKK